MWNLLTQQASTQDRKYASPQRVYKLQKIFSPSYIEISIITLPFNEKAFFLLLLSSLCFRSEERLVKPTAEMNIVNYIDRRNTTVLSWHSNLAPKRQLCLRGQKTKWKYGSNTNLSFTNWSRSFSIVIHQAKKFAEIVD